MGGRGSGGAAATSFGSRDRSSRPGTARVYADKPKHAFEYAQREAEKLGWTYTQENRSANANNTVVHTYGTFSKGDVRIGVMSTDRPRSKGRISSVAVRKNGIATSDYFDTGQKNKRKAIKDLLVKYGG